MFGTIKRPLIEVEIYSKKQQKWLSVKKVLADTGADICLMPKFIGNLMVEDITAGVYKKIRGVVPNTFLNGFIHELEIRIGKKEFTAHVFIADSEDVTPILGRAYALDLFRASFDGNTTTMEEK